MPPQRKRPHDPASVGKHGGCRQKLRRLQQAGADGPQAACSQLVYLLTLMFCWGDISGVTMQKVAAAAMSDGLDHPELQRMAQLGDSGATPNNIVRDFFLWKMAGAMLRSLSLISIVTCNYRVLSRLLRAPQSMLYPHAMFAAVYHHYPAAFIKRLCGGAVANITTFWEGQRGNPAYDGHPMRADPEHVRKCIPITIHGDGVPVAGRGKSWSKSLVCYSWCSLLCRGPTLYTQFVMYLLWKTLLASTTRAQHTRRVAWSLLWLSRGKWPTHDADGDPIAYDDDRGGTDLIYAGVCATYIYI